MFRAGVGVEHAEQDAQNQRTEREAARRLRVRQIECRTRKECDEQNAVEDAASFFGEHTVFVSGPALRS